MTSPRVKISVGGGVTISREDGRWRWELLRDSQAHASRTRKIPWDFFLARSRSSCTRRAERSECRKFNLIADTIFDWQTAREHVCFCECNEGKTEWGKKGWREKEIERMDGTESVTSRIVRPRRSFSFLLPSFYFRREFIVHSFADIRSLARQAVDWTVLCTPFKRYFSFSIWFVGTSKTYANLLFSIIMTLG